MKKFSIELKWALIFVAASLLWMLFEKSAGWHDEYIDKHPIYTNLFAIVAIAVYVLALLDKKRNYYNGRMDWTQGFLSGVVISIVIAVLSPLTQYVTALISPDYFNNMIDYSVKHKLQTREQAEAYFNYNNYTMLAAMGGISMGVVTSAVVALVVKSKSEKK